MTREFLTTPVEWHMHLALAAARDRSAAVPDVTVPTAFLAGRYDVLATSREVRAAAGRIPGASYDELWGTHYLPLERPSEVTAMLRALVERSVNRGGAGTG